MSIAAEQFPGVLRPPFASSVDPTTPGQATWIATGIMATLLACGAIIAGTPEGYVAVPISLIVLIAFLVRPLIGFSIMLAARPTLDLWSNTQIIPLTHGHPVNANTLMASLVLVVGGAYICERWDDIRRAPSLTPLLIYGVLAVITIPFSLGKTLAITECLRYAAIVVMYAIAFTLVRNRRSAKILAVAILASCIVPVAVAWHQVLGNSLQRGNDGFFRAHGTLVVVDAFGIFLALIITFATALTLSRFSRWSWLLWVGTPFVVFALVNSYGRTGWIASTFGLVVLGSLRYRALLVIIPILLVVLAVAVPSTTQRFQDLGTVGNSSGPSNTLSGRIGMWRDALPHVKSRPVVGIGFGSDAIANGKRQVANDYVRALVETGIPGFVVYLWVLISCLIAGYWGMELARFGGDQLMRALTLGSFAVVPAYMLVSLTANMMTQIVIAGMFWSMAAIGHAYLKRDWDGLRT